MGTCNALSAVMLAFVAAIAVAPLVIALYAYLGYPMVLWALTRVRRRAVSAASGAGWPSLTVTVPVYNAVSGIRATLEALLELDYPRDRLQVLVLSDASTDGTDAVVNEFAERGVELLRAPERRGKTAAENAAVTVSRGDIIVNVDATVLVPPASLKRLVRAFDDPTIGVASGRDISTGADASQATRAESGYVGYEMWLRDLETQAGSIVGASGCFYGFRRCIHDQPLPRELSWDFASTLIARKRRLRSVSVPDAVCMVPRTPQVRTELRRKVRTMARGIGTLYYHRALMNPFRYGQFALMLISHKLFRWLPYLLAPISVLAIGFLSMYNVFARAFFALIFVTLVLGAIGIRHSRLGQRRPLAAAAFVVAVFTAGFLAWCDAIRGTHMVTWEPTPRPTTATG
jgi:cellulose synthase/poly-beta-1,6-N-acetylglucosamine synthase-like glycosyltransferase